MPPVDQKPFILAVQWILRVKVLGQLSGSKNQNSQVYCQTLTDVEKGIYVEDWSISSEEVDAGEGWKIEKRRLHGGVSDGVDIITVDNGNLSFIIVPTRGMGIWKGECRGISLGWDSPVKCLVHPRHVNLESRGGLGWLDGFNEWIVRCGIASFGAPGFDVLRDNQGREMKVMLTLHGKIANIPASVVKVKIGLKPPFEIGVEGVVYETSMFGSNLKLSTSITTVPGSNTLKISDTIENLRSFPDETQLLYHCNFGNPFLEKGARLVAPIKRVAPRDSVAAKGIDAFNVFGAPETGFVEQVYFMDLFSDNEDRTRTVLVNRDATKAVSVSFSKKNLPCFTLWKNTVAKEDGYVAGLEPGTSFPNPKRFEREKGRVKVLKPGEKFQAEVALSVHLGEDEVAKAVKKVEAIRGERGSTVYEKPIPEFSLV